MQGIFEVAYERKLLFHTEVLLLVLEYWSLICFTEIARRQRNILTRSRDIDGGLTNLGEEG